MEQRCFNDLFVIMCRLLYKEFLPTMIKIRKLTVLQPLPREQGINEGHKVKRQSISQERGSRQSSFLIKRMFTEGDPILSHTLTPALGAACCSTDKEQRIYEKQHEGILLWNNLWHSEAWCPVVHGVAKSRTWLSNWTELNWIKNLPENNVQDLRASRVILWNIFKNNIYPS